MFQTHKFAQLVLSIIMILSISFSQTKLKAVSALDIHETSKSDRFLNPDGTLKLDGSFSGAIDLQGWNVRIDTTRGPIFASDQLSGSSLPQGWSALGPGGFGNGALWDSVWAIAISGSDVYVGGFFTDVKNNGTTLPAADYIAKWDGTNWSALGSDGSGGGSLHGFVTSIAIIGSDIYVAGALENINNNGTVLTAADYVAKWDGTNWSALGSNGSGNGSLDASVTAISAIGNNLYVGGNFTDVNNNGTILTAADKIAKWNGTNWSALGSNGAGNGSLNSAPQAIAASGSDVYVGGGFTNVNNNGTILTAADYIAKWNGTNWSALGSNGSGDGSLSNSVSYSVWSIALSGNNVYVGGQFMDVNNNGTVLTAADWIAKWDGTNWSALGSNGAGNGPIQGTVLSLAVSGSDVYAGGWFTDVKNNGIVLTAADHIAKWDGANWSALGSNGSGDGSITNAVWEVAASGSDIYVGGDFTDVNNNGTVLGAADHIAGYGMGTSPNANIQVIIAGGNVGNYNIAPKHSTRQSYAGLDNGPVRVTSTLPLVASERVAYSPDGGTTWTSYSELMGLPVNQLSTSYAFPWYNNLDLNSQLRFGNVGTANTTVTVTIGGIVQGSYALAPNASKRISYAGLDKGPVKVTSSGNVPIIASMRVAYFDGSEWTSFSEMMGLPSPKLTNSYVFPWYNNIDLNSQLRFGNVGTAPTTVTVTIGGIVQGSYALAPNASKRISYAGLDKGPVRVTSSGNVPIIASMRVAYFDGSVWTDFSEMMGLPSSSLSTHYSFPVYDNVTHNSQLRFGNVGTSPTTVTVTVNGVLKGTYNLGANQSQRISYAGLDAGPVVIQSSGGVPIIASERVAYFDGSAWTSFAEMMGLPQSQLSTTFLFPWYNNLDIDTQLRFGIP